jgi:colanic acid biosynthesis glycosyl transferase WcaI
VRVIILNQFFYPDHSATSQLMTDLAESLVEQGITVTALSGRGRYNGGERLERSESYKGVRIERAWATSFGKKNVVARVSDYLSFYLGASWKLLRLPRHDIVMALTTPPLIGLIALSIGRLRRMRIVSLVQDIYPDVAVSLGALKERSIVTRLLNRISRFTLRRSHRIVVLGECMRERVIAKVGDADVSTRIDVIHNWADGEEIAPLNGEENSFASAQNLAGKFVILFSGNLGRVNEFRTVLEAARNLHDREDILFLFIGEGAKAAEIEAFAKAHDLRNIRMLPYQPRENLKYSLAAGDASLVTLADGLAGLSVPSKTYGILAAGRPIIFVGDASSSTARIVKEKACGAVVSSGDSDGLTRIITDWALNREKLSGLNRAARAAFDEQFDRSRAVKAYLDTLAKCMESSHSLRSKVSKLEESSS